MFSQLAPFLHCSLLNGFFYRLFFQPWYFFLHRYLVNGFFFYIVVFSTEDTPLFSQRTLNYSFRMTFSRLLRVHLKPKELSSHQKNCLLAHLHLLVALFLSFRCVDGIFFLFYTLGLDPRLPINVTISLTLSPHKRSLFSISHGAFQPCFGI